MNAVPPECPMRKEELRARIRGGRLALTPDWVRSASRAIAERVRALPSFQRAATVCGYAARADEAQTDAILQAAWAAGKRVAIPAWSETEHEYWPAWLTATDPTVAGRFRIDEPVHVRWVEGERLEVVLVPGLAFDAGGRRLGHGKGYYDRMLVSPVLASAFKVGLAFGFQIATEVPVCAGDIPVDVVVTETTQYVAQGRAR